MSYKFSLVSKLCLVILMSLISFSNLFGQNQFITKFGFFSTPQTKISATINVSANTNYTWSTSPSGNSSSGTITTSGFQDVLITINAGDIVTLTIESPTLTGFGLNSVNRGNLLEIVQWGTSAWSTLGFANSTGLIVTATDIPNLDNLTSMQQFFRNCQSLNNVPNIDQWDVSNVTNFNFAFDGARLFNQDISTWTMGQATNLSYMFSAALSFNQNISAWELNANVSMNNMFDGCTALSCENYSSMLSTWASSPATPNGITFGAIGVKYGTNAVSARNTLTTTKMWLITDGGSTGTTCLPNQAPSLSAIASQITCQNSPTNAISFTVSDVENNNVTISATSSNTALIPTVNIVLSENGTAPGMRTVTITPASNQTGIATITLTPNDGDLDGAPITFNIGVYNQSQDAVVTTIAGNGIGYVEGNGTNARFNFPIHINTDNTGNTFVADYGNNRVRKIAPDGTTSLIAGSGTGATVDGNGASASFAGPTGIVVDNAGNIYVSEYAGRIRKITPAGDVTLIAGIVGSNGFNNGIGSTATFGFLWGLALDSQGNLYAADPVNNAIRKIETTAPYNVTTYATIAGIRGIDFDSNNNLFACNFGSRTISKITPAIDITLFASVSAATNAGPEGLAIDDNDNVFVTVKNGTVYKFKPDGSGGLIAGVVNAGTSIDGTGTGATFDQPSGISYNSATGNVMIIQYSNQSLLRSLTPPINLDCNAAPSLSAIASQITCQNIPTNAISFTVSDAENDIVTISATSSNTALIPTANIVFSENGTAPGTRTVTLTPASDQTGIATITLTPNDGIVDGTAITFTVGVYTEGQNAEVSTFAGSGGATFADGTGAAASFYHPQEIVFNAAGDLLLADRYNHRIRKISPAGVVTTFAGSGNFGLVNGTGTAASFRFPTYLALDQSGNLYVSEDNHIIRKITPAGVVTTYAGTGVAGSNNGPLATATFNGPNGLAFDAAGNLFIAERNSHLIRKITPGGTVSTFAGTGSAGSTNGTGTSASFNTPSALTIDASGNLYVTDESNHLIRKITPSGVVTTFAGSGSVGSADGTGTAASFNTPTGLTFDSFGNLYVADASNHKIRKITPAGVVTTFAGTGVRSTTNGAALSATFDVPSGLAFDNDGNLFVTDHFGHKLRKITPQINLNCNEAPTITTIAGQTTCDDVATSAIPFTIADANGDNLTLTATSSNTTVIPTANIVFNTVTGAPGARTVTITPAAGQLGASTIKVFVTDPSGAKDSTIFSFEVGDKNIVAAQSTYAIALNNPRSIVFDKLGNLYVAELLANRITKITPGGTRSLFADGLSAPIAIIIDDEENLYVAELNGNKITKILPDGTKSDYATSVPRPRGLVFDNFGNLYVSEENENKVSKISPGGVKTDFVTGLNGPIGLKFDHQGNLFIAEHFGNKITKVTPGGVKSDFATGITRATDIIFDSYGDLYVSQFEIDQLKIISPEGVVNNFIPPIGTNGPEGFLFDNEGNLYLAEADNARISKFIFSYTACNAAPVLAAIEDQQTCQNTALTIDIMASDADMDAVSVRGVSSNQTLLPNSGIGITGNSVSVTLTPALDQVGTTTITLTPNDGTVDGEAVSFTFTVLEAENQTITVSNCDSLSINGVTYYETGVYTQSVNNDNGCAATLTINATVGNTAERTINTFACDSYTYRNETYTESGTYTQRFAKNDGCDSVLTFNLTIGKTSSSTITETACDTYTLNGITYTESGEYTQTRTNASGCDSVITLNLSIKNSSSTIETLTDCDSYFWEVNGETYSESGVYTVNSINENGCPRVQTLDLTLIKSTFNTITETACDTYTLNDISYTNSGVYTQTLINSVGCDSIITLDLTILRSTPNTEVVTQCDTYTWARNGLTYTETGTYSSSFLNAAGCLSVATLNLTINKSSVNSITETACGSFTLNNQVYDQSGTYTQLLQTVAGCDSTIVLRLSILQASFSVLNISGVCDVYELNGETYTESGDYTQSLNNVAGCDSTIFLNLTLGKSNARTLTISECESLTINGETFTETGVYTQNLTNVSGCDSTLTIDLTIDRFSGFARIERTECSVFTFGGKTYTQSGTYRVATPQGTSTCDSTELVLTINQPTSSTITASACDFFVINNRLYEQSGVFTQVLQNAAGCDSVITLNISILKSTSSVLNIKACDSYTLGNQTYTIAGTYKQTLVNAAGCDSLVTLNLSLDRSTRETLVKETACESFTWSENGETYTETGMYRASYLNKAGCDSSIVLDLSINKATQSFTAITSCERFTWSLTGKTYTQSVQDTATLTNAAGCDSLVILNIQITPAYNLVQNVAACGNFTWPVNGVDYDKSGTYKVRLRTEEYGCDSLLTLNLVIVVGVVIDNSVDLSQVGEGILTANAQGFAYQWLDCENGFRPIPGATNRSFSPTKVGSYAVVIQGPACSVVSDCISVLVVGIEDISESRLSVYPNPSEGLFTVELSNFDKNSSVAVYDLLGKFLFSKNIESNKTEIDLGQYAKGNYMLQISNSKAVEMRKVTLR